MIDCFFDNVCRFPYHHFFKFVIRDDVYEQSYFEKMYE